MSSSPSRFRVPMFAAAGHRPAIFVHMFAVGAVALLLLLSGCGADEPEVDPSTQPTTGPTIEGLSTEQLEQHAEPMTPERAEELGIVDTSIHVERQISAEDSLLMLEVEAERDTIDR